MVLGGRVVRVVEIGVAFEVATAQAARGRDHTTNAVESLHRSLRKIIKTRGSFPTNEAALKLLFLAIRNAGVKWRRPIECTAAVGQFAILFGSPYAKIRTLPI